MGNCCSKKNIETKINDVKTIITNLNDIKIGCISYDDINKLLNKAISCYREKNYLDSVKYFLKVYLSHSVIRSVNYFTYYYSSNKEFTEWFDNEFNNKNEIVMMSKCVFIYLQNNNNVELYVILPELAESGDIMAQYILGNLYSKQNDNLNAEYWLNRAVDSGEPEAEFQLANHFIRSKQTGKEEYWLEKALSKNHMRSKYLLSKFLLLSDAPNIERTMTLLKEAVLDYDYCAICLTSHIFFVEKEYELALKIVIDSAHLAHEKEIEQEVMEQAVRMYQKIFDNHLENEKIKNCSYWLAYWQAKEFLLLSDIEKKSNIQIIQLILLIKF